MLKAAYGKIFLSERTSLNIGGPAYCWVEPESVDELLEAIGLAEKNNKQFFIIGEGTNILAQDTGYDGIIIKLGKCFDYIERESSDIVKVGGACSIGHLVDKSIGWGLSGCEFLSGIPASSGGAIFMNVGVRDINDTNTQREIKDILFNIEVLDLIDKKVKILNREDVPFSHRFSGLDGKCVLSARFRLKRDRKSNVNKKVSEFMKKREWIKRLGFPSAGSVFKNPDKGNPAGKLIEACMLKGKRIGQAEVSKVHANIIVNTGNASSRDVMELIELVQSRVKEKFNILLELELKLL